MTVQVSTRFKELIFGSNSFKSIFDQGRILVYSGTQPTTADHPINGSLLAQITLQGQPWVANGSDGGLLWEQFGAWMAKPTAAQWKLIASGSGVAGWFRIVGPATDGGGLTYASPRIDGAIGTDLYLTNPSLTTGQSLEVQQFNFTFPPVGG